MLPIWWQHAVHTMLPARGDYPVKQPVLIVVILQSEEFSQNLPPQQLAFVRDDLAV